jgi:hypothetical protein
MTAAMQLRRYTAAAAVAALLLLGTSLPSRAQRGQHDDKPGKPEKHQDRPQQEVRPPAKQQRSQGQPQRPEARRKETPRNPQAQDHGQPARQQQPGMAGTPNRPPGSGTRAAAPPAGCPAAFATAAGKSAPAGPPATAATAASHAAAGSCLAAATGMAEAGRLAGASHLAAKPRPAVGAGSPHVGPAWRLWRLLHSSSQLRLYFGSQHAFGCALPIYIRTPAFLV